MGSTSAEHVCPYCGATTTHGPERCRRVKEIEYFPNGHIKRIVKR